MSYYEYILLLWNMFAVLTYYGKMRLFWKTFVVMSVLKSFYDMGVYTVLSWLFMRLPVPSCVCLLMILVLMIPDSWLKASNSIKVEKKIEDQGKGIKEQISKTVGVVQAVKKLQQDLFPLSSVKKPEFVKGVNLDLLLSLPGVELHPEFNETLRNSDAITAILKNDGNTGAFKPLSKKPVFLHGVNIDLLQSLPGVQLRPEVIDELEKTIIRPAQCTTGGKLDGAGEGKPEIFDEFKESNNTPAQCATSVGVKADGAGDDKPFMARMSICTPEPVIEMMKKEQKSSNGALPRSYTINMPDVVHSLTAKQMRLLMENKLKIVSDVKFESVE